MSIITIILQSFLIIMFLISGVGKIVGVKMQVEVFEHVRMPQWFRVVTGFLVLAGVAGLIAGYWNKSLLSLSALWLAGIMFGAVCSHIRVKDTFKQMFPAFLLMVLLLVLSSLHVSELIKLFN